MLHRFWKDLDSFGVRGGDRFAAGFIFHWRTDRLVTAPLKRKYRLYRLSFDLSRLRQAPGVNLAVNFDSSNYSNRLHTGTVSIRHTFTVCFPFSRASCDWKGTRESSRDSRLFQLQPACDSSIKNIRSFAFPRTPFWLRACNEIFGKWVNVEGLDKQE